MNNQELLQLVDIDQEAGWRILQSKNIKLSDIIYSDFNQQQLAICLKDYTIFEQCLNHVLEYENNELFQFIYQYFDKEFTYNCLQMEPCFSCYKHTDVIEQIKKPISNGAKSKIITYQFSKIYEISEIQLDMREEIQGRIRIHLPGEEIIPFSQELKPPIIAQSITLEYPLQEIERHSNICICSTFRREVEECPRCQGKSFQISFSCKPVIDIEPITNESEVQQINNIISDLEQVKQQNYEKLMEYYNAISQYKFKVQMIQMMKDAYKEFNQAAILSKRYSRRVRQFYNGMEDERELCQFSKCVECSRRVLCSAENVSESLLRKLYFSNNVTHKERETAIKLLKPTIKYSVNDLDQIANNEDVYKEFCLQAQLYLKGENKMEFITHFLNRCKELKLDDIIIAILKTLNQVQITQIQQLLCDIKVESICLKDNIISQLFLIKNVEVQDQLRELVISVCKVDEILGLNLFLNGLEYTNDTSFYQLFDEIKIKTAGDAVVEYLVGFIKENYRKLESQKILKCFEMIQKCWNILSNDQLKWYIELDKLFNHIGQNNARINQIYNHLYQNMQINDNFEILKYFILQLLNENQQNQQIQRLSQMIHNLLFKKLEFRIRIWPYKTNQQFYQKEVEYSSLNFETLEQLKEMAQKDLGLEPQFDLIIQERIVNDTSLDLELVYKQFYIPEKAKQFKNGQKILSMNAISQDPQNHKEKQKIKELIQQKIQMEINYSIQGVGNHDDLPYVPSLVDDKKSYLEKQISSVIEPQHLKILFILINNLIQEGKRFMSTVQKIVGIMRFLCNSSNQIKQQIINCQGIVVLVKIYLQEPNENEKLLDFIDDLLTQTTQTRRRFSENIDPFELKFHDKESVTLLYQVINHLESNPTQRISKTLIQIIPLIIRDLHEPISALIEHFKRNIKFEWNNQQLAFFGSILHATPTHYQKLREATLESGIYQMAIESYLQNQSLEVWSETNANCLKIVFSVAIGSRECQLLLNEIGFIQQIFQHSNNHNQVVKELSKVCNDCINFIKNDDGQYIIQELKTTIEKLTMEKEQKFEQSYKNKKQQIMKKFQKSTYNQKIQSLQIEKGLQCVACKEGYSLSSNQLGIYVFSLPYQIPEEKAFLSMQKQETYGLQSVTYFTVIHSSCQKASVDCAIKSQKDEQPKSHDEIFWDCAIKNNGCKCNNFLPLKNGNNYEQTLEIYFKRCEKILKNKITSKCWLLLNDLKGLIFRMAQQDDLSVDAGASTYEHNLKLIPIMMTAIIYCNVSQYSHLMSTQQTSFEYISIAIIVALFHPYQDWQHYLGTYSKDANPHLLNAIKIVDTIMVNILSKVPNDSNYQKALDKFLNQDQMDIVLQFEKLPIEYNKK
ncbi:unnamed protein product (macronuclear) [Paramecium tetraurelia]|uniref:E3 ubiquitin ligase UBR4 C-terminal domain-containing protein n=1 Tax=Paramecium tetraurelia TaxID=5888 RepID=A0DGM8_PARTE|nr:uncharacterized protein GSPATT00002324001 [Paramecium tetraurelia]CAK82195.1 unnamed protein product [Paramecium tetraurelia]|eukprot:XP_001449592.1 hypothetical protein (macronuclear) [Paramecium tetraurelia strain d4-2]